MRTNPTPCWKELNLKMIWYHVSLEISYMQLDFDHNNRSNKNKKTFRQNSIRQISYHSLMFPSLHILACRPFAETAMKDKENIEGRNPHRYMKNWKLFKVSNMIRYPLIADILVDLPPGNWLISAGYCRKGTNFVDPSFYYNNSGRIFIVRGSGREGSNTV